jgi:hypothetical protein
MIFQLPPTLADDLRPELERASVTGGQDNMPYPTEATIEGNRLILTRTVDESGNLQTPWRIAGVGQMMFSTATLMERLTPYDLAIELARGKINQLRCQAAEWTLGGLLTPDILSDQIRDATRAFSQALMSLPSGDVAPHAEAALQIAARASHELVQSYAQRVIELRHQNKPKFDTHQGCRLEPSERDLPHPVRFKEAFNTVSLAFSWQQIEAQSGKYSWEAHDRVLNWALANGLKVVGGPLIDFAGRNLPDWLWEHTTDLHTLSLRLAEFAETVVRRYQPRIRTWQVSAGSNCAGILAQRDEELIWLTLRLADAIRRVNPHLEIIVGLAHPWGDYLAEQERSKTPFIFADDLLRTGVKLAALELEFIMGVSPRGSYCRDLLDASRALDLYALLGVPIQATLAYPSSSSASDLADPDQRVNLGYWRDGYTPQAQADWAGAFAALALCKPYVRTLQWAHWSDAQPHAYPRCGLIDEQGKENPALQALVKLRASHLK